MARLYIAPKDIGSSKGSSLKTPLLTSPPYSNKRSRNPSLRSSERRPNLVSTFLHARDLGHGNRERLGEQERRAQVHSEPDIER